MARLFPPGYTFFKAGNALDSGTVTFYSTGTTDKKNTYPTSTLSGDANANPITLNSSGQLPVDVHGSGEYTVLIQDVNGATVASRDNVTVASDASDLFYTNDGTGAVAISVKAALNGFVTPQMFGALGDGTTDDTAAFQAAIDSIESATNNINGGGLFIPKGTYAVGALTVTGRTVIQGVGATSRLELITGTDAYMFTCTLTTMFRDFFIDGQSANQTAGGCVDLQNGADFSHFDGMSIYDGYEYGIKIQGINQVGIENTKLFNHGSAAAFVKNSVAVHFYGGTTFEDNVSKGLHCQGSTSQLQVLVNGCYFEDQGATTSGVDVHHIYCDALQSDQLGNTGNSQITVIGNYANGNTSASDHYFMHIAGAGVDKLCVRDNVILNCTKGAFEFGTITTYGLNDLRGNQYTGSTPLPTSTSSSQGFMFDDAVEQWFYSQEFDLSAGVSTERFALIQGTKNVMVREVSVQYTEATSADTGVILSMGTTAAPTGLLSHTTATSQTLDTIEDATASLDNYNATSNPYGIQTVADKALVFKSAGGKTGTGNAKLFARVLIH